MGTGTPIDGVRDIFPPRLLPSMDAENVAEMMGRFVEVQVAELTGEESVRVNGI
jgi:ribosomal protein S3AE